MNITLGNLITYGGCGLIVIVFIIFLWIIYRISVINVLLKECLTKEDKLSYLSQTALQRLAQEYRGSINISINNVNKSNIPSSEFFTEIKIWKTINLNYKLLDTASSTLVGLGLLFTFAGLTYGIQGFNSENANMIQQSIQGLLSGMGAAFYTSLAGMGTSLCFTAFFDKPVRNKLSQRLYELTERLDKIYYIDDIELTKYNQQVLVGNLYSALQNDLKSHSESLAEKLTYTNSEGLIVPIANAIRDIMAENSAQTAALKSFSTDLAMELNQGFDESLSRQMQQKILPLMESVDSTTKAVIEHIDKMAETVSSPATDMMEKVVEELKQNMQKVIGEFSNGLSKSASTELEGLAIQLGNATKAMAEFPQNMEQISATLQLTINEVKTAISEISNTSATTNTTAMKQMQEQIAFATGAISNSITEVREVMAGLTNTSNEQSKQITERLANAAEQMSGLLSKTVVSLSSSVEGTIKSITDQMTDKQSELFTIQQTITDQTKKQMQEQSEYTTQTIGAAISEVKDVMASISSNTQQQNFQMVNMFKDAANQMGSFLSNTVSNLSTTVQDSVKGITDDVNNKQADLLALQESTTIQTRKLLEMFNHGLERLERMNEYITGTMNGFKEAQGEITVSTSNLRGLTGDMKLATELFNKGQNDYAAKLAQLQVTSQKGIDQVSELLKNSGQMSEEYAQKFEVIKQGLGAIFSQLQSGLIEYSRTVKDTTDKYLAQYTSSLTQTTGALASAIDQQNQVTEMLSDIITRTKRL